MAGHSRPPMCSPSSGVCSVLRRCCAADTGDCRCRRSERLQAGLARFRVRVGSEGLQGGSEGLQAGSGGLQAGSEADSHLAAVHAYIAASPGLKEAACPALPAPADCPAEVLAEMKTAVRDYASGQALMQQCSQDTRSIPSKVLSLRLDEYRKEHHLRSHIGAVPSSANTPIYHPYFEALAGTMPPAADSE